MSFPRSRRLFLGDVGKGMLIATIGPALAGDLRLARAAAEAPPEALSFGELEPLVRLLQETPIGQLNALLVKKIRGGTDLKTLTAAGALANARTFGGEDYVGFHTMMALGPAYRMSREQPQKLRPLPVMKVLYRNTNRIGEQGGRKAEVLHAVPAGDLPASSLDGVGLRGAVRAKNVNHAERIFAGIVNRGVDEAFNALLVAVEDDTEVHRTVLPYRAWEMLDLVGREQAQTLLRQSVRYCVKAESWQRDGADRTRQVLPALMEKYKLMDKTPGTRGADDAFVEKLSQTIFSHSREEAAEAAAAALADGFSPDLVGEAISLAANQIILRDVGRQPRDEAPGKPLGSVHGDSIGVHACDSANAWRHMARAANPRNTFACVILGAYQVARDRVNRGGDFLAWQPLPLRQHLNGVRSQDAATLLAEADDAIRGNLQARAAAIVHRYGELGHAHRPMFDLMLKYAISEDGSLHAEKYYRTTSDEFANTRPAFRWRQAVALARVTASEYGRPAPGMAEAREMIGA
ncbi:MAG TPA: hypothetical protein VFC78_11135 [Tepidisphaeraceae bacterium]|nr:hypothetical protein [Tepidisphaeraceae bacterium]